MISKFFIERPVLANVLAILMVVIGAVAVFRLPIEQYPDVVPPTVQVSTRYPGAGARTVIESVALPIEQQVNGVEGMIYMQSYAAADGSEITKPESFEARTEQALLQGLEGEALEEAYVDQVLPLRLAHAERYIETRGWRTDCLILVKSLWR